MKGRILIIEQEKNLADRLKTDLSEQGYCVEAAFDTKIGFQLFASKTFDLIVLDADLPKTMGSGLFAAIRKKNALIPIIIIYSTIKAGEKPEGYDAPFCDFIAKPFGLEALSCTINALLEHRLPKHTNSQNILRVADLTVNLDSGVVIRGSKTILLTAKEFRLIEYLIKNKNRLLSRKDLAMNVWNIDFDTKTNVVDVYISYIRNKIDRGFEKKLIRTHIGMGYMIREEN
ncbi:MAG TPA: response regulator transcription factor [Puia sp.]|nr:response regulator transcription factor [Puia sp.]